MPATSRGAKLLRPQSRIAVSTNFELNKELLGGTIPLGLCLVILIGSRHEKNESISRMPCSLGMLSSFAAECFHYISHADENTPGIGKFRLNDL